MARTTIPHVITEDSALGGNFDIERSCTFIRDDSNTKSHFFGNILELPSNWINRFLLISINFDLPKNNFDSLKIFFGIS